jgi:hypothetical protein
MPKRPPASRTTCAQHHSPKIRVRGQPHCVVEYGDAHLGRLRIVDVFPGSAGDGRVSPACLLFEDGHALPLYCPDCGEPRLCTEGEANQILSSTSGLYVVGVGCGRLRRGSLPVVELALARGKTVDPNHPGSHRLHFMDLPLRSIQEIACPPRCGPTAA